MDIHGAATVAMGAASGVLCTTALNPLSESAVYSTVRRVPSGSTRLDDVSAGAFLLARSVAGQSVLDVVSIVVLGVWVYRGGFSYCGGGVGEGSGDGPSNRGAISRGSSRGHDGWSRPRTG